jgi:hypothetical protein
LFDDHLQELKVAPVKATSIEHENRPLATDDDDDANMLVTEKLENNERVDSSCGGGGHSALVLTLTIRRPATYDTLNSAEDGPELSQQWSSCQLEWYCSSLLSSMEQREKSKVL